MNNVNSVLLLATLVIISQLLAGCKNGDADPMVVPDGGADLAGADASDEACNTVPAESPADVCLDMADAIATSAFRCGMDYLSNYDGFIDAAADGDCRNVLVIRDPGELYSECMPWLCAATCEALQDPAQVPSACRDQLLRSVL